MNARFASTFEALRPSIQARLEELRAVDVSDTQVQGNVFRDRNNDFLERIQLALSSGDEPRYRAFLQRWVALRIGEGATPESLVHSIVTVYDVITKVARNELPADKEAAAFIKEIVRLELFSARTLVSGLADELARLQTRRKQQEVGGS